MSCNGVAEPELCHFFPNLKHIIPDSSVIIVTSVCVLKDTRGSIPGVSEVEREREIPHCSACRRSLETFSFLSDGYGRLPALNIWRGCELFETSREKWVSDLL